MSVRACTPVCTWIPGEGTGNGVTSVYGTTLPISFQGAGIQTLLLMIQRQEL